MVNWERAQNGVCFLAKGTCIKCVDPNITPQAMLSDVSGPSVARNASISTEQTGLILQSCLLEEAVESSHNSSTVALFARKHCSVCLRGNWPQV